MLQVNVGCGRIIKPGWLNIDMFPISDLAKKGDILDLPLSDNSVDEIIAHDVVEHVSWQDSVNALKEIHRVLKPTGKAEIRVPDIDELLHMREIGKISEQEFIRRIFGGQDHPGNFHYGGFTQKLLLSHCAKASLKIIKNWCFNGNRNIIVQTA